MMMAAEPPAKRPKTAPPAEAASSLPGKRMLHQTVLVVLFLVRVSGRRTDAVTDSLSQIAKMVDSAFHRCQEMISSKLESFQEQIDNLHQEVRQLTRMLSSRYTDEKARKGPNQENATAEGSNTNTRLCFLNALRLPVYYTQKKIIADDNAGIKVGMFEGKTIVTSGLLSRVKIEILVLRDDFSNNCRDNWTEEEFDAHIAQGRDRKDLVIGTARLTNGEVEFSQIRFTESSCRTPSRKFILAARVCKSENMAIRVHEAIMEPITVLDRRNEQYKKSHPPRLCDDVYRLNEISKDGDYNKRLQNAQIYKVEDLLKALNKNPDKLCEVLQMKRKGNSWSKLTKHVRECILEDRQEIKAYISNDGNVLFFNCVYDVVGATFGGEYVASEQFDSRKKVLANKLKEQAYCILDEIPFSYVMKDKIPELICTVEDFAHEEINQVTLPSYPNAIYHPEFISPNDLSVPYYEGSGTPQQQILTPSIMPQLSAQCLMQASYPLELENTQRFQHHGTLGASTSSQPNIGPHHLPQQHQGMMTTHQPQSWGGEHEQEKRCSVFSRSSGYMDY